MAAPLDKCCSRTPYAQPPEQPPRTIRSSVRGQPNHALHSSHPIASAKMRAALREATLVVLWVATMAEAMAEGATADATVEAATATVAEEAVAVSLVAVAAAILAAAVAAIWPRSHSIRT